MMGRSGSYTVGLRINNDKTKLVKVKTISPQTVVTEKHVATVG